MTDIPTLKAQGIASCLLRKAIMFEFHEVMNLDIFRGAAVLATIVRKPC